MWGRWTVQLLVKLVFTMSCLHRKCSQCVGKWGKLETTSRKQKKPKAGSGEGGYGGDWHHNICLRQISLCLHTGRWQWKENSLCASETGHLQETSRKPWVDMSKQPEGSHLSLLSRGKLRLQGIQRLGLMDACSRRQVGQHSHPPRKWVLSLEKSECIKCTPVGRKEGMGR